MKPEPQIRGATWRIWDLHIHTPKSLVQSYGADSPEVWERFLLELEALPEDMKVIGINDYWFLDGYRKVLEAKTGGRLKNIDMIFPVVEMRLDQFGGTDGALKRVNLHVIFDPELDIDVIETQFLNALSAQFSLTAGIEAPSWQGVINRQSLEALGAQIKAGVPDAEKKNYQSDLIEGFNNLNVSMPAVRKVLNSSFLRGKAILGLGKTEWAAIKWNDGSIANKKSLVTEAKFLFTAFDDPSRWSDQVAAARAAGVNHKILDCSDAHTWSADTKNKDRLGACSTWMNTTPSFAGLLHALEEFDQRIFVGLEPSALGRHQRSPERFIETVRVSPTDPKATAFDYELPLNPGFVAIVGNKGQGKSALLDSIALAGNSSRTAEFAFLTPQRYLSSANKTGRLYKVDLSWLNGTTRTVEFGDQHVGAAPIQVEYLPQRYVERVCTIDPLSEASHEFEDELREVLFTHIPDDERAGETSFDALLRAKTESAKSSTTELRARLRTEAENYVSLLTFIHENPIPDITGKLALKAKEIAAADKDHKTAKDQLALLDAAGEGDDETKRLRNESTKTRSALEEATKKRSDLLLALGSLEQQQAGVVEIEARVKAQELAIAEINADWTSIDKPNPAQSAKLLELKINRNLIADWRSRYSTEVRSARVSRDELDTSIRDLENEIARLGNLLAAADGARELARQRVLQVEERLATLRGNVDSEGSEIWLSELLERAKAAPSTVASSELELFSIARQIHVSLEGELRAVTDLYGPASKYIEASAVVKNAGLEFKAELSVVSRLQTLRTMVDGRKSPDLLAWLTDLPERVDGKVWPDIEVELSSALRRLAHDRGAVSGPSRHPVDALRAGGSAEDFIVELLSLEWIEVRFGLTGDGLPLALLSPGQRGLVLALFYLIVDLRTTPLLLDQPEENLDNATIASLLVPAIQEASRRRQTIIVTHNANLAIVGDADQIVHCTLNGGIFGVTSGCISELSVAKSAVDVLEGTKPAFDIRRHKYEAFPDLT